MEHPTSYFPQAGGENTGEVLRLVAARARDLGIRKVLVPSTTGATALAAADALPGLQVIVMTHEAGFAKDGEQEFPPEIRQALRSRGIEVYTVTHAFGGLSRAMRDKFKTHVLGDIIANSLRIFGQGMKVAVEITLMAADCGAVRTDESVVAMGGSDHGLDTAIVCRPANAQRFFDLKVQEILCKPHFQA
ncbi:MAG: hypothetical protein NTY02_07700 [Acidobacteria bacterium]|nr:hypothetical protein [Acidobacteriota bacterium]